MSEKQWVQHNSGQGKKWPIAAVQDDPLCWVFWSGEPPAINHYHLPKSEYRICDPPEVWEDVTEECHLLTGKGICYEGVRVTERSDCRLRKVEVSIVGPGVPNGSRKQRAFIVERRKP